MRIGRQEIRNFLSRNGYLLIIAAWLFTLSFLTNNYWGYLTSPGNVQKTLENNIQKREAEFLTFSEDTSALEKLYSDQFSEAELKSLTREDRDFYFSLFKDNKEVFWSTNTIAIDDFVPELQKDSAYLEKVGSGYYELIKRTLEEDKFIIGIIPVKEEYNYSNSYLKEQFYKLSRIKNYAINVKGEGLAIKNSWGADLFHIQYKNELIQNDKPTWLGGVLGALGIVFILIFLTEVALWLGRRTREWKGLLFLAAAFFLFRFLSYQNPLYFEFRDYELFDSTIYASSAILSSLGDLFINVALSFWLIIYGFYRFRKRRMIPSNMSGIARSILSVCLVILTFYIAYFISGLIKGLVLDSNISFDVTDFFSLNIYSFVGFIILVLLGFSFYFLISLTNQLLIQLAGRNQKIKYLRIGAGAGIGILIWFAMKYPEIAIWTLVGSVFYYLILDFAGYFLRSKYFMERVVLWLLVLTFSITVIVDHYIDQREIDYRHQLIIKLTKQVDPTLIFNLGVINTSIENDSKVLDYFEQKNSFNKPALESYILGSYFSDFENEFDFKLFAFNNEGKQLGVPRGDSLTTVLGQLLEGAESTEAENLFFTQTSFSNFHYTGILAMEHQNPDSLIGHLYYVISSKSLNPESIYPELLMQSEGSRFWNDLNEYSYAVYSHNKLTYNHGDFPFSSELGIEMKPENGFSYFKKDGYSFVSYRIENDQTTIMVKKNEGGINSISLFAYLFGVFLVVLGILGLFVFLISTRLHWKTIRRMMKLSIRNRVLVIIIFIVLFVFVSLGASTIQFYINRYNINHQSLLDKELTNISNQLQSLFRNVELKDAENLLGQKPLLKNIEDLTGVRTADLNMFDLQGNLKSTTQSLIYKNELLSPKINPLAYFKLNNLKQIHVIQKEKIGALSFFSAYVPITNMKGEVLGYLNRPYFASQADLKSGISNFLVTLINLNAFIFLLAGLLALLFTNSIIRPFSMIIQKLRSVNLTGTNEELEWKYDDEIGELVKEYNRMVHKLSESAEKLAKTEREGAWREMARQIAHEIKNPLTPMKLSLQHLQRIIKDDSPRKDETTNKVARTLIEQIDHLSKIASDFSDFAQVSIAKKVRLNLIKVLNSVVALHQGYDNIELVFNRPASDYYVLADKTELNRVFTNLILNAMQAIPEDRAGRIEVAVEGNDTEVVVRVSDNGTGVDEALKNKIFTPNFTTKSSGTGLGLAISKNIILQMKGDIWYENRKEGGTTFYVKIPVWTEIS